MRASHVNLKTYSRIDLEICEWLSGQSQESVVLDVGEPEGDCDGRVLQADKHVVVQHQAAAGQAQGFAGKAVEPGEERWQDQE